MAQVSSLMLARFTRLPRRSGDTWQGGVVRMPMWVDGPDGTPYRPWGGVWVSLETGVVNGVTGIIVPPRDAGSSSMRRSTSGRRTRPSCRGCRAPTGRGRSRHSPSSASFR